MPSRALSANSNRQCTRCRQRCIPKLVQASRNGLTTFEAYERLGLVHDQRRYDEVGHACTLLGVAAPLVLLTNNPDKLAALQHEFDEVAARNKVLPINPDFASRAHPNPPPPGGRAFYTFYAGTTHLFDATAPGTRNRTHTFTIDLEIPEGAADGVLVADGGLSSGYTIYVKDGRPSYTYNYFRRQVTTITAPERLTPGHARIELHFAYEGGGTGKPATATMRVNGVQVGQAHLAQTVPNIYSYDETFDVGEDTATPVGPYTAPFPFTGTIQKVELRTEGK